MKSEVNTDIMIEMIREHFVQATHQEKNVWDSYPIVIDGWIFEDTKIFLSYKITIDTYLPKKDKTFFQRFFGSEVELIEPQPTNSLIRIDRSDYEFRLAYKESVERNKKIDSILG